MSTELDSLKTQKCGQKFAKQKNVCNIMTKQKYFERSFSFDWKESEKEFYDLLDNGWKVILAIPIQSGKSCHTYTSGIHYVLEKEVGEDE